MQLAIEKIGNFESLSNTPAVAVAVAIGIFTNALLHVPKIVCILGILSLSYTTTAAHA